MTKLKLVAWNRGLKKVSLIEAVKTDSTKSLSRAKEAVDRLLAGEVVTLEFSDEAERDLFRRKAEALGAVCT